MATTITIADLFPYEEGMILFAEGVADESLRHIAEVANGAVSGCRCYGCGRPMVAKNSGYVQAHHFCYRPLDKVCDCTTARETALHIRAQQITEKHRRVTLPATTTPGIDGNSIYIAPERPIDLMDVRLETAAGELIRDIIATMPDGRTIFIEIANTHPSLRKKIAKLAGMRVEVVEITVRGYRRTPLDELDDITLDLAPREMRHCSERMSDAAEIAEQRRLLYHKER